MRVDRDSLVLMVAKVKQEKLATGDHQDQTEIRLNFFLEAVEHRDQWDQKVIKVILDTEAVMVDLVVLVRLGLLDCQVSMVYPVHKVPLVLQFLVIAVMMVFLVWMEILVYLELQVNLVQLE